ncbi:hypothetical protein EV359DRAFT_68927 [Lentinula novae-zelandiae]|nr:hypothetical protein EV359DRAFT_68927 [Lentinula novae-zelandiae]
MFAQFFANMEMHPELRKTNGERTMALYQAETRLSWYKENEKGAPFDLAVIMEETLNECRNEIRSQDHAKALKGSYCLTPLPELILTIQQLLGPRPEQSIEVFQIQAQPVPFHVPSQS